MTFSSRKISHHFSLCFLLERKFLDNKSNDRNNDQIKISRFSDNSIDSIRSNMNVMFSIVDLFSCIILIDTIAQATGEMSTLHYDQRTPSSCHSVTMGRFSSGGTMPLAIQQEPFPLVVSLRRFSAVRDVVVGVEGEGSAVDMSNNPREIFVTIDLSQPTGVLVDADGYLFIVGSDWMFESVWCTIQ